MLASITQNSGRVVAVEPDAAAHGPLLRNRASHNANFHVLKGTVSEQPLTLSAHLGWRCEAYKRHMGYTDEQLRCADDLSETPPKPKPHLCAQVG